MAFPPDSSDVSSEPGSDARLAEVQRKFNAALPPRLEAIEQKLAALTPGPWQDAIAGALQSDVHSLAGSAGFFGFAQLGVAASELEHLLITSRKRPILAESDLEMIHAAAARLRQSALSSPNP